MTELASDLAVGAPELALGAAVVVALITLVFGGNHDNPAEMPDKYDTTRYTQYVGELQGQAATAYGPAYNPNSDPIQQSDGGLSLLSYIQQWTENNLDSSNTEVSALAKKLLPLWGDANTGATGTLEFQHDIANEAVIDGSESGTYVSIYDDASQALGEIRIVDDAVPAPAIASRAARRPGAKVPKEELRPGPFEPTSIMHRPSVATLHYRSQILSQRSESKFMRGPYDPLAMAIRSYRGLLKHEESTADASA